MCTATVSEGQGGHTAGGWADPDMCDPPMIDGPMGHAAMVWLPTARQ